MEESLPAAAAPDENAAHEETGRVEDQPASERKRLRVPSSVLLTLLVALLSVWVAPAFARQWDERQKARELQAVLAQDVAVSTTAAIGDGLAALGGAESLDPTAAAKEWDTARARLEAELRVYYPEDAVIQHWYLTSMDIADLQGMAPKVRTVFDAAYGQPRHISRDIYRDALAGEFLADLFYEKPASDDTRERAEKRGDDYARWVFNARETQDPVVFLAKLLRRMFAQRVDTTLAHILKTTPEGFSTTRRDLLRDLLP
jgi:hypothetical protein